MGNRIYIGNMSWDTTQETLTAALTAGGREVKDVHIVNDRETGRPRGFAFAEFNNEQDAQAAIAELDGKDLDGRALKVNEAQERKPGGGGGGRGGGGGYGGGGGGGRGGDRW
jgi:RNA recognition motif-containing protein